MKKETATLRPLADENGASPLAALKSGPLIAAFAGDVTEAAFREIWEMSYPGRDLEDISREDREKAVRILNAGMRPILHVLNLNLNDFMVEDALTALDFCRGAHFVEINIRRDGRYVTLQADWMRHILGAFFSLFALEKGLAKYEASSR